VTDGQTDRIAIAYTRYSYAVARKNWSMFHGVIEKITLAQFFSGILVCLWDFCAESGTRPGIPCAWSAEVD